MRYLIAGSHCPDSKHGDTWPFSSDTGSARLWIFRGRRENVGPVRRPDRFTIRRLARIRDRLDDRPLSGKWIRDEGGRFLLQHAFNEMGMDHVISVIHPETKRRSESPSDGEKWRAARKSAECRRSSTGLIGRDDKGSSAGGVSRSILFRRQREESWRSAGIQGHNGNDGRHPLIQLNLVGAGLPARIVITTKASTVNSVKTASERQCRRCDS